jgi:hypothetical protein
MRKLALIAGFIFFIGPLLSINHKLKELEVEQKGELVKMKIISKPISCLGTKAKWFMDVEYKGVIRPIQIGGNYCEKHKAGDYVDIRYIEGGDIILLPNYSTKTQFISIVVLSLFGLFVFVYYGIMNKPFKR